MSERTFITYAFGGEINLDCFLIQNFAYHRNARHFGDREVKV